MATETTTPETRTYETFDVVWTRLDASGSYESRWTGYDTYAEAYASIAGSRCMDSARVERRTFTVEIDPAMAHLYKPGIVA